MRMSTKPTVLFVCVHNAGRSQMAAGYLRALAGDRIDVLSAGSEPKDRINPRAVEAMAEEGIDIAGNAPAVLTTDAVRASDVVITMGCGDACPIFPGKRYEDWVLDDPAGQDLPTVRRIRDDIRRRVETLIADLTRRPASAARPDPYRTFRFRVGWQGGVVAGVNRMSAFKRATQVVVRGGETGSSDLSAFEPIALEDGVTHDAAFDRWARSGAAAARSRDRLPNAGTRRDLVVDIANEAGQRVARYRVFRAWVSHYQALPDLDAGANAVAIRSVTLQIGGWERDESVTEPVEPDLPARQR